MNNRSKHPISLTQWHESLMTGNWTIFYEGFETHRHELNVLMNNKTPLMRASSYNQLEMVEFLLQRGALVDQVDDKGETALHKTLLFHYNECAELLIQNGANVNTVNHHEENPLWVAVSSENIKGIQLLFKEKINTEQKDIENKNVLFHAINECRLEAFKELLKQKKDWPLTDEQGNTWLMSALIHQSNDIINELMNKKNLNHTEPEKNKLGLTALMLAVMHSEIFIIREMVKNIDVNEQNLAGETAIMMLLKKNLNGNNPNCVKIKEIFSLLLENGADLSIKDHQGKTALQHVEYFRKHRHFNHPGVQDLEEWIRSQDHYEQLKVFKKEEETNKNNVRL